jgi:hypothetical protein
MRDNENKTMKAHAIFSYTFSIFLAHLAKGNVNKIKM